MEISQAQFEENFAGFIVVDCAIRSNEIFYFSLCEDASLLPGKDEADDEDIDKDDQDKNEHGASAMHDGDDDNDDDDDDDDDDEDEDEDDDDFDEDDSEDSPLRRRIVCYAKVLPEEKKWANEQFSDAENFNISVSKKPKEQVVAVDLNGEVFIYGSGDNGLENPISKKRHNGILRGGVTRCRTIDGHVYVAGTGRSVAMRRGKNSWKSLMKGLPFTYESDWQLGGFRDIDGFNGSDIYAVGGVGDVWHYDGCSWNQILFPSNIYLYSVCCAGDGEVYISGYQGNTFKGRGQRWTQIYKGNMTTHFKDMVWHEKKIWCTSDYGLWQISDGKLISADVDSEIKLCSGHLSTGGDVMLLAGHSGAAYLERGVWHKFF